MAAAQLRSDLSNGSSWLYGSRDITLHEQEFDDATIRRVEEAVEDLAQELAGERRRVLR